MYYRKSNSIGLRRKFAEENQVISFGGVRCVLKEEALRAFADDCLRKLDGGESESSVQAWVRLAIGDGA